MRLRYLFLILVGVFVLIWPGGLLTGWEWGWQLPPFRPLGDTVRDEQAEAVPPSGDGAGLSNETVASLGTVGDCHDNQTSSFTYRPPLVVNGTETSIQFRDPNCVRAVYHTETGVAIGQNYDIVVPQEWSIGLAAVSCQVHPEGGQATDYTGGPFIVIRGPWSGAVGCFEAGLHGVPTEWEYFLLEVILPIHRSETGKSNDQAIFLGG